jgi:hypothetical protein
MSKKFLSPIKFLVRDTDPSSGSLGETYFNSTDKSIRMHNGLEWVTIIKSDDPVPFFKHTHTYDGDVHTIDIQDPVLLGGNIDGGDPLQQIPVIIGEDGGDPNAQVTRRTQSNLSQIDGGIIGN